MTKIRDWFHCPFPDDCVFNDEMDCKFLHPDAEVQGPLARKRHEPTGIGGAKADPKGYHAAYYEQNRERIMQRLQAWQDAHVEERRAYRKLRRAKEKARKS